MNNEMRDVIKINELSSRIIDLTENLDDITTSDLQGCIDAVIMDAIRYGRGK